MDKLKDIYREYVFAQTPKWDKMDSPNILFVDTIKKEQYANTTLF
jgi:hypothetical protein